MLNTSNYISRTDRYSIPYYEGFLLSLIICWLPFKLLAYLAPFFFLAWFILRANSGKTLFKLLIIFLAFLAAIACYSVFYLIVQQEFIIQNSIIFFITYGSFLIFLVLPSDLPLSGVSYHRYLRVIKIVIVIESLLGILQVILFIALGGGNFDFAAGDVAQGTLNPLSFLEPGGNFNNQIYTNNLLILLLFYTPYCISKRSGIWICVLGFFAVLVASVWHLFIAFLVASIIVTIYFTRSLFKLSFRRILIAIFLAIIVFITISIQPKNLQLVSYYFNKIVTAESPKTIVTISSLTELPKDYPWVYITGLGPGQYASRAGLIGTGKYFGEFENPKKIPLLIPASSEAFKKYIYPMWDEVATRPGIYGNSTMARPFHSVLSLIIELGFLLFIFLVISTIYFIRKIKRIYQSALAERNLLATFYAFSCCVLTIYIILISFFENYLEVAHAVFIGFLSLKYFYSSLGLKTLS